MLRGAVVYLQLKSLDSPTQTICSSVQFIDDRRSNNNKVCQKTLLLLLLLLPQRSDVNIL